jgi:hypothetical protein
LVRIPTTRLSSSTTGNAPKAERSPRPSPARSVRPYGRRGSARPARAAPGSPCGTASPWSRCRRRDDQRHLVGRAVRSRDLVGTARPPGHHQRANPGMPPPAPGCRPVPHQHQQLFRRVTLQPLRKRRTPHRSDHQDQVVLPVRLRTRRSSAPQRPVRPRNEPITRRESKARPALPGRRTCWP